MSCAGPLIKGLVGIKYVTCTLGRGRLVLPCLGKAFANASLDKLQRRQKEIRRNSLLTENIQGSQALSFCSGTWFLWIQIKLVMLKLCVLSARIFSSDPQRKPPCVVPGSHVLPAGDKDKQRRGTHRLRGQLLSTSSRCSCGNKGPELLDLFLLQSS